MWAIAICAIMLGQGPLHSADTYTHQNNIPPRLQWDNNSGYCGEVSLISAGLYYGQYLSQYDARAIATKNSPQNSSQLLLGVNDAYAAAKMHLNAVEWNTDNEQNTNQFLSWVKQNVVKGYPVAIGIFTNEYRFYNKTNPKAGDDVYDHIVPVFAIESNHPLNNQGYYADDIITFSDNGLWGTDTTPYIFSYSMGSFQADREQANAKKGAIYSLYNGAENYGIAILGVLDKNGDTVPVRVDTNVNFENPSIENKSSVRPAPMPLILTVTVSHLQPNVLYNLYKYNDLAAVPDEQFNANAGKACESWKIQISSGSTYVIEQTILSDEIAVFRAVKASAP